MWMSESVNQPTLSPVQTARGLAIFLAVPALWWLSTFLLRVPREERWHVASRWLRTSLVQMYLLVPVALLPAAAVWWVAGAALRNGAAPLSFVPFYIATYGVGAAIITLCHRR